VAATVAADVLPTTVTTRAITFSYPNGWSRTDWDQPSSFAYMVAAVSNHALKTPCTHSLMSWSCGQPVDQVQAGTLLVEWWQNAFPGWTFAAQTGTAFTVGGFPAKMQDPADLTTVCPNLSAESAMQVIIDRPEATGNYFAFTACFKGPAVAAEKSEALDILASAQFK
jgi:hypothetical protein